MNTKIIMSRWVRYIQSTLTGLHAYQSRSLAIFSFGMAQSQRSHLSRICAYVPTSVQPLSTKRRLLRLLGNQRLDVKVACLQMGSWLKRWNSPSCRLLLLMDETPLANHWRVLKISVALRRRSVPLCWMVYPLSGRKQTLTYMVKILLCQAHKTVQAYAPEAKVTLLADRGFCWPQVIRSCHRKKWDYLLRAQGHTRFQDRSETGKLMSCKLKELAPCSGTWWCGEKLVFKKAGWIKSNVVALWPRRSGRHGKICKEPWLLLTSLPPSVQCGRWYARRIWQEESFRDEKSHGFQWQESQVGIRKKEESRVDHLLLVMALAQLWLSTLGQAALSPTWKGKLGLNSKANRKLWGLMRKGWILLIWMINQEQKPNKNFPCAIRLEAPT